MPGSILAEPRRKKQKLGIDPRNLQWRHSKNNFGAKLLGKMGWTEGKGIGKNEQGMPDNLRLKPNYTAKGLGCDTTIDKDWAKHNDDFAQILANLNKQKKTQTSNNVQESDDDDHNNDTNAGSITKEITSESKIERLRQRLKRKRYIKNLANFSDLEKSAIFGSVGNPQSDKTDNESTIKFGNERQSNTISTLSLGDYFAQKMREKGLLLASEDKKSESLNDANSSPDGVGSTVSIKCLANSGKTDGIAAEERKRQKSARKAEKRKLQQL